MQVETNITVTIGDQVIILTKSEAKSLYDALGDALGEKKIINNDIFEKLKPIIDKQKQKDDYGKWPIPPYTPPIAPYPKPYEIWCKDGEESESPYSTEHTKREL